MTARARFGGDGGGPDLLSALPDGLLHAIMSNLKARQTVQTCVLSTRWRDLWRSVPCLDVDLAEFRAAAAGRNGASSSGGGCRGRNAYMYDSNESLSSDEDDGSDDDSDDDMDNSSISDHEISSSSEEEEEEDISSEEEEEEEEDTSDRSSFPDGSSDGYSDADDDDDDYYVNNKKKEWGDFSDFTTNLMSRCNIAQLDSFRLHIGSRRSAPPSSYRQATRWLHRAMKYCTTPAPAPAPTNNQRSDSSYWRLRRLHLSHVRLDSRFADHVNSVCRSMEELKLHDCHCRIRSIASDSLKTLVLRNCIWRNLSEITSTTLQTLVIDGGSNNPYNCCLLVVSAPAIQYLHLNVNVHCYRGGISLNGTTSSLSKASIHLHHHRHRDSEKMGNLGGDQLKLLRSVSNVTSLKLSGVGLMVLGYGHATFQEFKNLRNLVLGNCDLRDDDFHILGFFLQSSPNLEKLTLRHCKFPEYSKKRVRKLKRRRTTSSEFCGMDLVRENLKLEIIYKNGGGHKLVKLLMLALGNHLSKSCITLTKV